MYVYSCICVGIYVYVCMRRGKAGGSIRILEAALSNSKKKKSKTQEMVKNYYITEK